MKLTESDIKRVQITLSEHELVLLVRVIQFTLDDLDWEYSTRTGFSKSETQAVIEKLHGAKQTGHADLIFDLTEGELFIIRQNLMEVTLGIWIEDFFSTFGVLEAELENWFSIVDQYGEEHGFWKNDPGGPSLYWQHLLIWALLVTGVALSACHAAVIV